MEAVRKPCDPHIYNEISSIICVMCATSKHIERVKMGRKSILTSCHMCSKCIAENPQFFDTSEFKTKHP